MWDVPPDHPLSGRWEYCTCPTGTRLRQQRIDRLFAQSRLTDDDRAKTFETFLTLPGLHPEQRAAVAAARMLIQQGAFLSRGQERTSLLLYGDVGRGKSGIAVAAANAGIADGKTVLYITVPDLLDHLRAAFRPGADASYDDLFEQIRGVDILVLDDLGTEKESEWAAEKLSQIIDFRYRACRMTITTSNLSPDEIRARFEQTGDWHGRRIIDRLKAMSVVLEVKGRNLREAWDGGKGAQPG